MFIESLESRQLMSATLQSQAAAPHPKVTVTAVEETQTPEQAIKADLDKVAIAVAIANALSHLF